MNQEKEIDPWIFLVAIFAVFFIFLVGGWFGSKSVEDRIGKDCSTVGASMAGKTQILCAVNR